ncbi:hypothetical protein diail_2746 [Diaporthe ilicicola]|nr:hypothetical protein diail_2746 [Diaporthe ilicicola]
MLHLREGLARGVNSIGGAESQAIRAAVETGTFGKELVQYDRLFELIRTDIRSFAMFFPPFRFTLALALHSLWLHCHQAALKQADLNAHGLLVEAADTAKYIHVQYNWRELPAGSLWA